MGFNNSATAFDFSDDETLDYKVPVDFIATTVSASEPEKSLNYSKFNEMPLNKTSSENDLTYKNYNSKPHEVDKQAQSEKLKDNIDGTVLVVLANSVKCEVISSSTSYNIDLPKSMFPDEGISFGTPINIKLDNCSGIMRPIITIRKIDKQSDPLIINEIDALISEL